MGAYSLEKLRALVPPPLKPVAAPDPAQIRAAELKLGLDLPADFVEIVSSYGDGCWQGFWYLLNPASPNPILNLLAQAGVEGEHQALWAERSMRESHSAYPHAIWPDPGGILPWALTDNGGRFFWRTRGPRATWSTVYYADRSPDYEILTHGCGELLLGILDGTIPIFREEFSLAGGRAASRESAFIPVGAGR